jgi:eukaryotic-like serine/threonine-protein kinase
VCLASPQNAQAVASQAVETDDRQLDDAEHEALEGSVLAGRYRVARVVTIGASTILVDAIDLANDGQVSVKIVQPEHARGDEFRRKFGLLAEVSGALTHPNIASVSDWGEIELGGESTVFWVVDALGGGSLRDLLDRGRLLAPGQALVVGLEACRALDAAHQKGLFHTELTPSKMVFGTDRRLRIIDFGMARLLASSTWQDAATVPTHIARYCSPEQALGLPIDAKTDVYALALILIEAVTGAVPFSADSTVATMAGRVDKLLPVSADLGAMASVLERAGRPESGDRFTAAEFGRALVQIAPRLAKPEPIPIIATGAFDTTALRRPTDPTGGLERPAPVAPLAGLGENGPSTTPPADPSLADPSFGDASFDDGVGSLAPIVDGDDLHFIDEIDQIDELDLAEPNLGERVQEAALVAPSDPAGLIPEPEVLDVSDVVDADAIDGIDAAADPDEANDSDEVELEADDSVPGTEEMSLVDVAQAEIAGHETTVIAVVEGSNDSEIAGDQQRIYDDEAPSRRRHGPKVALALVLVAGLAALGYAASLLLQPKSFEVPSLAGVDESAALNQILDNDWEISTERDRSNAFPEVDMVIRTVPGPGVELEEGESFTLVLSDGPEFRQLPELDQLPFEAAVSALAGLDLIGAEAPERVYSEDLPVGSVISWRVLGDANAELRAGADVLPGETIEMVLSQGPEPRVAPTVVGLSIEDATAALGALQLSVERGDDVFSDDVPAGLILSQTPVAGELLARDAAVRVELSKGPDVVAFPSLEGLLLVDAETVLAENGFTVGSLLGTTEGTFVQASVDGQNIEPGTALRRGQTVDLIFL